MKISDNVDLTKHSISLIVAKYRGEKTLRDFADDLSSKLIEKISYQSIKNWEDGEIIPLYYPMVAILTKYDDWRWNFAYEILQVLKPKLYAPDQPNVSPQIS